MAGGGFFNWRSCQPGSNQITSRDQYQWLAVWPSHRGRCLCLIMEGDGDDYCFLHDAVVERARDSLCGIDCLGQPISPVPQQKTWEAPMAWLVEQSGIARGTCGVAAGEKRNGFFDKLIWKTRMRRWRNTFRLDCSVLGQPTGRVRRRESWEGYLRPMKQTQMDTCAIVACIVGVEGMCRKEYEESHGKGTFPVAWKTAERWPGILLGQCEAVGIWKKGKGACVAQVLDEIQELRGVGINSDEVPVMPLRDWKEHSDGLTPERVAALLDQGPCIGRLWVCPWYSCFNAANNDGWVYRGCGRDEAARDECRRLYPKEEAVMGSHAVVCSGYRFCETGNGDEQAMHVLVLDNHRDDGPQRWIDVEELDALFTLTVDCPAAMPSSSA